MELQAYFAGDARLGFQATPGAGEDVPLWVLGSSLYGAQLAAALGLPYAFASHFAPGALDEAVAIYRRDFQRSEEHTSELQSLMRISYAVFCLKKKKTKHTGTTASKETIHYQARSSPQ